MVFGLFSKKNDILNGIENKDVDEVTSYLKKLKNINEIFSRPDNKDEKSWSYLVHASKFGNSEIVQLLLDNGSDINKKDSSGKSSLYWASLNEDDTESARICSLLIKKGVDVNAQAHDGRTAVFGAVVGIKNYQKNTKTLEVLLKAGGDPNIQMTSGTSALYLAVDTSFEAVKMLLKHKANPNIETIDGATPLFQVGFNDNTDTVSALIKAGADVNHGCLNENAVMIYPLDVSIDEDNQLITEYLIENGAKFPTNISQLEIDVQAFENQGQKDSHDELGEEGKYHYEFHFKDINSKQVKSLKSGFEGYTWDMGFAVTDFEFKQEGDLFKILFESKKFFYYQDDEDFDDKDFAQNIATRILGKEQFICSELWSQDLLFEEKEIVFIELQTLEDDDEKCEWSVEVSKYGGLDQKR